MSTKIFTFPSAPKPKFIHWGLRYNNNILTSPINNITQVINNEPAQWHCHITLPPLDPAQLHTWQCFLFALEGRTHNFYFELPQMHYPKNFILSVKKATTHATNTITVNSNQNNAAIIPGSTFCLNKELKIVRSFNISTNTLYFYPYLRKATSINDQINFHNLTGIFRLSKDEVNLNLNELNISNLSFSFEESI